MGTNYTTILVGNVVQTYNDNPPSDDGSQTEANRGKFATITSDLTAPLHSAIINMDTKIVDLVDEGPSAKSGTYTTVAGDYAKTIECTGTFTLSLLNPSGQAGYKVTAKNAGSGTITVNVDGGANIDGASSATLNEGQSRTYRVNAGASAYFTETSGYEFPAGTEMVFFQAAAPPGWTQNTTNTDHALRVVSGSGGGTGGTDNFSSPPSTSHTHTGGNHTHAGPLHAHQWYETSGSSTSRTYNVVGGLINISGSGGAGGAERIKTSTSSSETRLSDDLYTSENGNQDTGSGGSVATSSDGPTAFAPKYVDVIICAKD